MNKFVQMIKEEVDLFDKYIKDNTITYTGTLYHGTFLGNLYDILNDGSVYGNTHGELLENDTLSTSINSNVLSMFSDTDSGLMFEVNNLKVFIIPDWFHSAYTNSGLEFDDVVEEAQAIKNIKKYKIPMGQFEQIDEEYLSEKLAQHNIYAGCYQYTANAIETNNIERIRDEYEIVIFRPDKNLKLSEVQIEDEWFDTPEEAVQHIEDNYDIDTLERKNE